MNLLRRLLTRERLDRDLADEIQQHLDEKVDELVEAGLTREEALDRARREFGNRTLVEEQARDVWRWHLLEDAWADLRYAVRQWRRTPAFTIATLVTLVLGIGANTAVFSVVNALVLRPLPFPEADRLVAVEPIDRRTMSPAGVSYPNFFDIRRTSRTLSRVSSYRDTDLTLTGRGLPVHLRGQVVSWEFFQTLETPPALGRPFVPADEQPATRVVVLSYAVWVRHFAGDRSIVGRAVSLDGSPHVVVGVAPAGFSFPVRPGPVEFWTTLARDASSATRQPVTEQRGARLIETIARLAPSTTLAQANAELGTIVVALRRDHPGPNATLHSAAVRPEVDRLLGPVRGALLLLWATVTIVLLIACANVSSLLVARTSDRRREFDVRLALGGSRGRIVRQLVVENLLLGLAGSLGGLAVAYGSMRLLAPLEDVVPRLGGVGLDGAVLTFAAAAGVATTIAVTLAPALRLTRARRDEPLLLTARSVVDGRSRIRRAVVVGQVAASLILLSTATLLVTRLVELLDRELGFDSKGLVAFNVSVPSDVDTDRRVQFFEQLVQSMGALPGVRRATTAMPLPLAGHQMGISFAIEGQPSAAASRPTSDMAIVSPGYFSAIGTPLVAGRDFTQDDDGRHPRVVIVNQAFADKFFPAGGAIGKRIESGATGPLDDGSPMREIVGIVGNARQSPVTFAPEPIYYLPFRQLPWGASVIVRADVPAETLAPTLQRAATDINAGAAVHSVRSFDEVLDRGLAAPRLVVWLMGGFAATALALTATGLYGLLAYGVQRRMREFGVRVALGATRAAIVRAVTVEAAVLVAIGLVLGGAGVVAANAALRSQLPLAGASLPLLLGIACGLIVMTALCSTAVPAARAAGVDPTEALRSE
jgi:predicted permease